MKWFVSTPTSGKVKEVNVGQGKRVVRLTVKAALAPETEDLTFDILTDGVSIFSAGYTPRLRKGRTQEVFNYDDGSWEQTPGRLLLGSVIELDITSSSGAKDVTFDLLEG